MSFKTKCNFKFARFEQDCYKYWQSFFLIISAWITVRITDVFRVKVELHRSTALPPTIVIENRHGRPRCVNNATSYVSYNVNNNVSNGKIVNLAFTLQCLWVKGLPEIRYCVHFNLTSLFWKLKKVPHLKKYHQFLLGDLLYDFSKIIQQWFVRTMSIICQKLNW